MCFWGVEICIHIKCANTRGKNVICDLCFSVCSSIVLVRFSEKKAAKKKAEPAAETATEEAPKKKAAAKKKKED